MLRYLLIWMLVLSNAPAFAARVALVIGNAAYRENPLKNPVNDARDMSVKLQELGFRVMVRENLKRRDVTATLREFRGRIQPGDEALFFYAGHGLQVKGANYLPTVDAEIRTEDDADMESLSLNKVFDVMDEAQASVKLVFLDACRNNPYTRNFRSAERGLSRVTGNAPGGALISFATKPGQVAADGEGRNGLYTQNLLKHLDTPGQAVELMIKGVLRDVKRLSKGAQEPWVEGSLEGDFYFRQPAVKVASLAPVAMPVVAATSSKPPAPVAPSDPLCAAGKTWTPSARFEAEADEVYDTETNLTWKRCAEGMQWDGKTCSGFAANISQATLNVRFKATGAGWRVPNIDELASLRSGHNSEGDKSAWAGPVKSGCVAPALNPRVFPGAPTGETWSASTSKDGRVWLVNFENGGVSEVKTPTHAQQYARLWLVKGKPLAETIPLGGRTSPAATSAPAPLIADRYELQAEGAEVLDRETGLVWQRCTQGMRWDGKTCSGQEETLAHWHALERAGSLAQSTGKPWRLPTERELVGLLDKRQIGAKIDADAFPQTPANWFWSADPGNSHLPPSLYLAVNFEQGLRYSLTPSTPQRVRLVRLADTQSLAPNPSVPLLAGRFEVQNNGAELKDHKTRLIWKRCVAGMSWEAGACLGSPEKDSYDAIYRKYSAYQGWRMATLPELKALLMGDDPASFSAAFPGDPEVRVWANTGSASRNMPQDYVDFSTGKAGNNAGSYSYAVRLVMDGQ